MPTILHLIPTLEGGGAERQMAMLAVEQARRGWQVHVALRRGGVHERGLRAAGVVVHPLGDLRGFHPRLVGRVASIVRRIRPDVIQTWMTQMDFVGGLIARLHGIPWILSERSSEIMYRDEPVVYWARHRLGRGAAAIVANSADGARYWSGVRLPAGAVAVVPNALDLEGVRGASPVRAPGVSEDTQTILFVGRLVESKAPDVFVEAVARMPGDRYHALIIGEGPFLDELQARIAALAIGDRVSVLPFRADWWGLLATAAALVNPSRFEGQPNVVLEAMVAGCPLVVSDIPAHREILDEQSACVVPVDDAAAFAAAIEHVLSDPEAARARAARAMQRVSGMTIHATADAYDRIYERVLHRTIA